MTNDQEIMEEWNRIAPLVEAMKAKYPPEMNMDGLEPALTQDIIEIVRLAELRFVEEEIEKIKTLSATKYPHSSTRVGDEAFGYGLALNDLLTPLIQRREELTNKK